jgi:hypothetical protein
MWESLLENIHLEERERGGRIREIMILARYVMRMTDEWSESSGGLWTVSGAKPSDSAVTVLV